MVWEGPRCNNDVVTICGLGLEEYAVGFVAFGVGFRLWSSCPDDFGVYQVLECSCVLLSRFLVIRL